VGLYGAVKAAPPTLKPNPSPSKADPIHQLPTKMWCESERGLAGQRTAGCLLGYGDPETSVYNQPVLRNELREEILSYFAAKVCNLAHSHKTLIKPMSHIVTKIMLFLAGCQ